MNSKWGLRHKQLCISTWACALCEEETRHWKCWYFIKTTCTGLRYIYMYIYTYICLHHFVIWAENSRASKTLLWVGIKLHTEHQLYPFIHPTAIVITIRVCCGLFHPRESVYMQIQSFQHPWMVSNGNWTCCASTHRKDYLGRGNHQNHLIRCTTFERYTTLVHLDMQVGTRRGVWWSHVSSINRSLCLYYNTSTESTDSTLSSRSKRLGLSAHPSRLGVCKIFFPWRRDGEWRKPKKGDRNWTVQFKNKPVLCMIWQPWYVRNQIHWYWSRHIYLITVKLWHCSEKILQQTSQQTTTWDLVKWSRLTRIILWPVEMPRLTCLWYLEHLDLSCLGILPPVCRKGMNSKATGMPKMCIYIYYIYIIIFTYIYIYVCVSFLGHWVPPQSHNSQGCWGESRNGKPVTNLSAHTQKWSKMT